MDCGSITFNFQSLCCVILVFLFYLVAQRLPTISAASFWEDGRGFQRPGCLMHLDVGKRESPYLWGQRGFCARCLWWDTSPHPRLLAPLGCSASQGRERVVPGPWGWRSFLDWAASCGLIPPPGVTLPPRFQSLFLRLKGRYLKSKPFNYINFTITLSYFCKLEKCQKLVKFMDQLTALKLWIST